jgi:hypothetical protein
MIVCSWKVKKLVILQAYFFPFKKECGLKPAVNYCQTHNKQNLAKENTQIIFITMAPSPHIFRTVLFLFISWRRQQNLF